VYFKSGVEIDLGPTCRCIFKPGVEIDLKIFKKNPKEYIYIRNKKWGIHTMFQGIFRENG